MCRRCLADTSTNMLVPPHSSGMTPYSTSSWRTRSGFAPGLSILLTATTMGTSAAFAWLMASMVCGMTPSSAATTSTMTSVTWAPRARMAVNASWPGVSMNVICLPSISTTDAPMCWVMPPASLATTPVSRMASRSDVLPWSTWPMTVTTGGRGLRSSSLSWYTTAYSSSGDTTRTLRPMSSAMSSTSSSLMDCVRVSTWPSMNRRLMMSLGCTPRISANFATVAPWGISTTESSSTSVGSRPFSMASSSMRSRFSASRFSLRFLRRPSPSCVDAAATAARASASTLSRCSFSACTAICA